MQYQLFGFAVIPAEAGIQMTVNYTDSGSR
jgi:hypothetical protein